MTQAELRQLLFDFIKEAEGDIFTPGGQLILQLARGLDDPRKWGHYKLTKLADLEGREFEVLGPTVGHNKPGILWLDILFDPRTRKYVPAPK